MSEDREAIPVPAKPDRPTQDQYEAAIYVWWRAKQNLDLPYENTLLNKQAEYAFQNAIYQLEGLAKRYEDWWGEQSIQKARAKL